MAAHYAGDLVRRALLEAGEPVKASEAARLANHPAVDLRLARVILATNPGRFTSTDRKWTLWSRFADPTRSTERNLEEVLESAGQPAPIPALARELAAIYGRSAEHFEQVLTRVLADREFYFESDGAYGLASWLLITEGETE